MNDDAVLRSVTELWDRSILPRIEDYIRIPCKSPAYDKDWEANGHIEKAVRLVEAWCKEHAPAGATVEIVRLRGRTPVLLIDVPATPGADASDTVLLYGHYDKQPEMSGWSEGLGPWLPVRRGDKLYGRGGADDGYAAFASLAALRAVREHGGAHRRAVVLIEGCEESGSFDLPFYLDHLGDKLGHPSLVVCLDSGSGNYEQLWLTTSLRGLVAGTLSVQVLDEGVHSGDASGVVPSSFRILRQLLDRVEDARTGKVLVEAFHVATPEDRRAQAEISGKVLGPSLFARFPWSGSTKPMGEDVTDLVLARTWRPTLSVTGAAGLPPLENAGNVLRPHTSLKLSLRIPPGVNGKAASAELERILLADPPYGARVSFQADEPADGWNAPTLSPWLERSLEASSQAFYGKELCFMGEGGTIPFMAMLGRKFPEAQFVITGVLGPQSNAHGPNEFLHVPMAQKLTACVARVLDDHAKR